MFARLKNFANGFQLRRKQNDLTLENSGMTMAQIDLGYQALSILGLEDSEQLHKQDITLFLFAVGLSPTDDVIDSKIRALNLYSAEVFTFAHVCHIWHAMLQDLTDEADIIKRAFQFFDKDGNGEISVAELRKTMQELGGLLSDEEIQAFMEVMDVNNDGVVGYEEFLETLRDQPPPTDTAQLQNATAAAGAPAAQAGSSAHAAQ